MFQIFRGILARKTPRHATVDIRKAIRPTAVGPEAGAPTGDAISVPPQAVEPLDIRPPVPIAPSQAAISSDTKPAQLRLVIWHLNDAFWHTAPNEAVTARRQETRRIVTALASRGIASSICCRGDPARVQDILRQERIWDYLVFPSVDKNPVGPRLADIIAGTQVPASAAIFISGNPLISGEAAFYAPGIHIAGEASIANLLENPLCLGVEDTSLKRVNHLKLLQHRRGEIVPAADDRAAFLRQAEFRVTIEHDLEPYLDDAISLIRGANLLTETPAPLPDNIDEARAELRRMLLSQSVQAGMVRLRSRYGDFENCGLYIQQIGNAGARLRYFCVSDEAADLGLDAWLYNRLGRPLVNQRANPPAFTTDTREIDWISLDRLQEEQPVDAPAQQLDYVYVRGTSDLRAVAHYFSLAAGAVYGEFNTVDDGVALPLHHSVFARHALEGLPPMAAKRLADIGYQPRHFQSSLSALPNGARAIWVLNFAADAAYALYRHNASGRMIPVPLAGFQRNLADLTKLDPATTGISPAMLKMLNNHFTYHGPIAEVDFKSNVTLILNQASPDTQVFIMLSREDRGGGPHRKRVNTWLRDLAADLPRVTLLDITNFVPPSDEGANQPTAKTFLDLYRHIVASAG